MRSTRSGWHIAESVDGLFGTRNRIGPRPASGRLDSSRAAETLEIL